MTSLLSACPLGKKKPSLCGLGLDLKAWQFPTFAWQTATLSSALSGFTSEFEMGSGGSRSLWSPSKLVSNQGKGERSKAKGFPLCTCRLFATLPCLQKSSRITLRQPCYQLFSGETWLSAFFHLGPCILRLSWKSVVHVLFI